MTIAFNPDDLRQMPVSERLRLMEELWSSLAERPDALAMPQWHRDELDARLGAYRRDPSPALDWTAVKAELDCASRK